MIPKTIKEHHANVRGLVCVITGNPVVTLHHCHGGSMEEAGWTAGTSKRGCSEALVLPLKADFHVGAEGIDFGIGVLTWEGWYGTQMDYLKEVGEKLGYDLFTLAKDWAEKAPARG